MAKRARSIVIKIKKEDLPKRRAGVRPGKVEKVKTSYTRKQKHPRRVADGG